MRVQELACSPKASLSPSLPFPLSSMADPLPESTKKRFTKTPTQNLENHCQLSDKHGRRTDCCVPDCGCTIKLEEAPTAPCVYASFGMVSLPWRLMAAVAACRGEVLDANFDELYDIVQVTIRSPHLPAQDIPGLVHLTLSIFCS